MKMRKKYILFPMLLLFLIFMNASVAQAEGTEGPDDSKITISQPARPSGLGLYMSDVDKDSEDKNGYIFIWDKDLDLYSNYLSNDINFGYDIRVTTLKNKRITKMNISVGNGLGELENNKFCVYIQNDKFASQGFIFKVRAYVCDEKGNKLYSKFSEQKVIIPRASISGLWMSDGNVKITWNKITGAANYTVYISKNGGKTFKKLTTTKLRTYTIKHLLMKKNYYVYVQANKVKYKNKKYNSTIPVCTDKTLGIQAFRIKKENYK